MKKLWLFSAFFSLMYFSFSQSPIEQAFKKTTLDTGVFKNWHSLYRFAISNNGEFVYFTTKQGQSYERQNLIIKSLLRNWHVNIPDVQEYSVRFSNNGKNLFCLKSGDSLCNVVLGQSAIKYISAVASFNVFSKDTLEYLVYKLKSADNELIFEDLKTEKQILYKNVTEYFVTKNIVVLKIDSLMDGKRKQYLLSFNIDDFKSYVVHDGIKLGNLVSNAQRDLAFINDNNGTKSIWICKFGRNATEILSDSAIGENLEIDRISSFSEDGSELFIYLKEKSSVKPKTGKVEVNVWSFTDVVVQSGQPKNPSPKVYLAVANLKDHRLVLLQRANEKVVELGGNNSGLKYLVNQEGDYREGNWNRKAKPEVFVVSVHDGNRKKLKVNFNNPRISPDGKCIIGTDESWADILSYEVTTGRIVNLTKKLPVALPAQTLYRDGADRPLGINSRGLAFAAWVQNNGIFIYDEFDIWLIDLKGEHAPINVTNGFGRKNKIVFRLIGSNAGLYFNKIISKGDRLILSAFCKDNKSSGFYEIQVAGNNNPTLLSMDNYRFSSSFGVESPVKAKDSNIYLVQRESATQSPNLYWTSDFKSFNLITAIFPEKQFVWLTSELKKFKTLDERWEFGVLYKPENFDKLKQYPVIIHYYENKSDELYKFHNPGGDFDGGQLDITWFVSHEYLVFTPDIHYKIGEPGKSVYNSVVGAANFLKTLPFVNNKKIAIQGHSWGGYETNYLVANTKTFAAAISSSGPSNFITGYLSDNPNEQHHCELAQHRLGKPLWEDIPMYIDNSPVFKAYNVTAPILTIHNKRDNNVPFIQGLEWFMALRRLGKRAWMLQYDNGGHGLGGDDYIDYIIRSTQFFDHYLKDSACPKWMLYGISAHEKGIDSGHELVREKYPTGKWLTPQEGGLLTDEQRKKVNMLMRKKGDRFNN